MKHDVYSFSSKKNRNAIYILLSFFLFFSYYFYPVEDLFLKKIDKFNLTMEFCEGYYLHKYGSY